MRLRKVAIKSKNIITYINIMDVFTDILDSIENEWFEIIDHLKEYKCE